MQQSTSAISGLGVRGSRRELGVAIAQHKLEVSSGDKQHTAVGSGCSDACLQSGEDDTSSRLAPHQRKVQR